MGEIEESKGVAPGSEPCPLTISQDEMCVTVFGWGVLCLFIDTPSHGIHIVQLLLYGTTLLVI